MSANASAAPNNRTLTALARLFTNVVSPPIALAALGVAVGLAGVATRPDWRSAIIFGVFICIIPLGVVIALYRVGRISDLHMSNNQQERHIPYLVGTISALASWVIFVILDAPLVFRALAVTSALGLGTLGIINRYWLISNHSASISMVAAFSAYAFGPAAALALAPVVGLVSAARLYLRRHTVRQLLAGIALGVASVLLVAQFGYFG
jgi:membrane-associated phospholipid phosphatase